jgi:sugar lactone lactonase YvrE
VTGDRLDVAPHPRILVDGLRFAEAPRWYGGRLWFSDIHSHRVMTTDTEGTTTGIATLDDRPSGLGFLPDGTPLVVSMLDRRLLRIHPDGSTTVHAELAELCEEFLNDMVVDPTTGRAYVGSRNHGGGADGPKDAVVLVRPDGTSCVAADGLQGPNGSVITPDGAALIVAETAVGRLTRFPIRPDGSLGDRTTFAELDGHHLDGICLDEKGRIWAGGGRAGLLCIASGGRIIERVTCEARMVIACVFGGPQRRDLFMTTASLDLFDNLRAIGLDRSRDLATNSGGRIEVLATDCRGAGTP